MLNDTSLRILDLCNVLKTLRETMEYAIPRDHDIAVYNQRKQILSSLNDENSFIGRFIKDNEEKLKEFKERYKEFLEEIYSENSTVLTISEADKFVRVDHTQHIKIFDYVIYLSETIRDIMFSHVAYARNNKQEEQLTGEVVALDEHFDRVLKTFLLLQEYQKSFAEFQKVMGETKGVPSPQSNFIVQNELSKLAGMLRFVRAHIHATDNRTLDDLDEVLELIEMTEGRRDRRDNKPFNDFFKSCFDKLGPYVNELAPQYQQKFQEAMKEMVDTINQARQSKIEKEQEEAKA
jgi:uncharacterized protein (UPF0305 family)